MPSRSLNSPLLLSVVIPTCNRNDELGECLSRLAPGAQTLDFDQYEVIVSDDGREVTAEHFMAEHYPWARWTQGPRSGIGTNRNNGARMALGKWFVFIDSDTIPERNCLATYAKAAMNDGGAIAFEGAIHASGDLGKRWSQCPVNRNGGLFWTANVAVQADAFRELGGFDPQYRGYNEDQDLYLRLLERLPIRFLPDAVVTHPVRTTSFAAELRRMKNQIPDWAYHVRKHGVILQQPSLSSVVSDACAVHTRHLVRKLWHLRLGEAALSAVWLAVSFTVLPWHYLTTTVPTENGK